MDKTESVQHPVDLCNRWHHRNHNCGYHSTWNHLSTNWNNRNHLNNNITTSNNTRTDHRRRQHTRANHLTPNNLTTWGNLNCCWTVISSVKRYKHSARYRNKPKTMPRHETYSNMWVNQHISAMLLSYLSTFSLENQSFRLLLKTVIRLLQNRTPQWVSYPRILINLGRKWTLKWWGGGGNPRYFIRDMMKTIMTIKKRYIDNPKSHSIISNSLQE